MTILFGYGKGQGAGLTGAAIEAGLQEFSELSKPVCGDGGGAIQAAVVRVRGHFWEVKQKDRWILLNQLMFYT